MAGKMMDRCSAGGSGGFIGTRVGYDFRMSHSADVRRIPEAVVAKYGALNQPISRRVKSERQGYAFQEYLGVQRHLSLYGSTEDKVQVVRDVLVRSRRTSSVKSIFDDLTNLTNSFIEEWNSGYSKGDTGLLNEIAQRGAREFAVLTGVGVEGLLLKLSGSELRYDAKIFELILRIKYSARAGRMAERVAPSEVDTAVKNCMDALRGAGLIDGDDKFVNIVPFMLEDLYQLAWTSPFLEDMISKVSRSSELQELIIFAKELKALLPGSRANLIRYYCGSIASIDPRKSIVRDARMSVVKLANVSGLVELYEKACSADELTLRIDQITGRSPGRSWVATLGNLFKEMIQSDQRVKGDWKRSSQLIEICLRALEGDVAVSPDAELSQNQKWRMRNDSLSIFLATISPALKGISNEAIINLSDSGSNMDEMIEEMKRGIESDVKEISRLFPIQKIAIFLRAAEELSKPIHPKWQVRLLAIKAMERGAEVVPIEIRRHYVQLMLELRSDRSEPVRSAAAGAEKKILAGISESEIAAIKLEAGLVKQGGFDF